MYILGKCVTFPLILLFKSRRRCARGWLPDRKVSTRCIRIQAEKTRHCALIGYSVTRRVVKATGSGFVPAQLEVLYGNQGPIRAIS